MDHDGALADPQPLPAALQLSSQFSICFIPYYFVDGHCSRFSRAAESHLRPCYA